jgi:hypothetical protein
MEWTPFIQFVVAFLLGGWVYSRGSARASIIPGEELMAEAVKAVSDRIRGNGHKPKPELPRVSS